MRRPFKYKEVFLWISFALMMILKFGYYGFEYYPVIDDWIQYGVYPLFDNIFKDVIVRIGTYSVRPLAGLTDPYIWGRFWGNMRLPFIMITMLHIASGIMIRRVLAFNRINSSLIFLIFFGILPLGFEATYWISAASRIVVGLFFMTLSLLLLCYLIFSSKRSGNIFIHQNRIFMFVAFFVTQLISFGFYEQVAVLSFFSAMMIVFANWKAIKNKWVAALPIINLMIIMGYYFMFSRTGSFGGRSQTINANDNFWVQMGETWSGISDLWSIAHFPLYRNGFMRGIGVLINNHSYLYMVAILIASGIAAYVFLRIDENNTIKTDSIKLLVGLLLFMVPYIPHLMLKDIWISNRNAFSSFIGFALVIEAIADILLRKSMYKTIKSVLVGYLVFIFIVVNISELTDYRQVSRVDLTIGKNILESYKNMGKPQGNQKSLLFGTASAYVVQNAYYHEHILNITDSDWALTGGVRAISGNPAFPYTTPIAANKPFPLNEVILEEYILFGIDREFDVFPLDVLRHKGDPIKLVTEAGQIYGQIEEKSNGIYVFKYAK